MRSRCEQQSTPAPCASEEKEERGAVLVLVAAIVFVMLGAAALAVDLSALAGRAQEVQNTADSAALAGIVEYRSTALTDGLDQAIIDGRAAIDDLMRQNGIEPGSVVVTVVWPHESVSGDLELTIEDQDVDSLFGGFGIGSTVERSASAQFLDCPDDCAYSIQIPKPFRSVEAEGDGDGYAPILVRDKLYAINHNASAQQIVCVNRLTQAPCEGWTDIFGDLVPRVAYAGSTNYNDNTPEMPHTGVVGTKIYWSATNGSGHRLYCWETTTDIACPQAEQLSGDTRVNENGNPKDRNRGGGTIAFNERIYDFTDDHQVHCWFPASFDYCTGYGTNGGLDTALGAAGFVDHNEIPGNHGSSIDRIVDRATGRIYSTLHVNDTFPICSSTDDPDNERVVVVNVFTGEYLTAGDESSGDEIYASDDGTNPRTWWDVEREDSDSFSFYNEVVNGYLDGDPSSEWVKEISWSADKQADDQWQLLNFSGNWVEFRNDDTNGYMSDDGVDIIEDAAVVGDTSRWQVRHWRCGDPDYDPPIDWAPGTWLHCWDTGAVSGEIEPCDDFEYSRLHTNASRFSGRLFFYYGVDPSPESDASNPDILGVCSTGYEGETPDLDNINPNTIFIQCVDINTGLAEPILTNNLDDLRNEIRASTGSDPGAWGDPHWNDFSNRLFYPTEHDTSSVLCWDFDFGAAGSCPGIVGETPSDPETGSVRTEDYGFISDGDCVFALGHNAYFWAFQASDTDEECPAALGRSEITRCECGADFRWGQLDFSSIDTSLYTGLDVRIIVPGTFPVEQVFPTDKPWHSIIVNGPVIDLDDETVPAAAHQKLVVEIRVASDEDIEPGENNQQFSINFLQSPYLTQ